MECNSRLDPAKTTLFKVKMFVLSLFVCLFFGHVFTMHITNNMHMFPFLLRWLIVVACPRLSRWVGFC